ncbi:MAG TPA: CpsD/CapB family tyrosine-protein kinase [Blastocatellia bacterium]|nr:CpsD/CapB family tyrosine-protein kinase [Blastocatellia bacterium]
MGKVYNALNKTARRAEKVEPPVIDVEAVEDFEDGPPHTQFDFMRYSLNAQSTFERERSRREATAQALVRRSLAEPAREVILDSSRIDPHIAAYYNARATDHYNKIAMGLITAAATQKVKRVLIASADHGDGRTCVTLNLARALARASRRVLVVDCDLKRPSTLRMLGIKAEIGIAEAFQRGIPAGAATIRVRPFDFNLLPTVGQIDNPAEVLASPLFWKMVQVFDQEHDFILFDSSPLLYSGDVHLLARAADTTVLVIRAGKLNSAEMAKAIEPFSREEIFGVVLNRFAQ